MLTEAVLYIAVFLTSIPFGMLLAYLCDDETSKDRKYILSIIGLAIASALVFIFLRLSTSIILSLFYLAAALSVMLFKKNLYRKIF